MIGHLVKKIPVMTLGGLAALLIAAAAGHGASRPGAPVGATAAAEDVVRAG